MQLKKNSVYYKIKEYEKDIEEGMKE